MTEPANPEPIADAVPTTDTRQEWETPALQELPVSATALGGGLGADAEGPT